MNSGRARNKYEENEKEIRNVKSNNREHVKRKRKSDNHTVTWRKAEENEMGK